MKWALVLHCLDGVRISKVPCGCCGALVRPGRAGPFQVPMLCSETLSQLGLWCADIGFNANVTIEELGSPDKIIQGFAPELYGSPWLSACADLRKLRAESQWSRPGVQNPGMQLPSPWLHETVAHRGPSSPSILHATIQHNGRTPEC